jgi:hypothetical protein
VGRGAQEARVIPRIPRAAGISRSASGGWAQDYRAPAADGHFERAVDRNI